MSVGLREAVGWKVVCVFGEWGFMVDGETLWWVICWPPPVVKEISLGKH